MLKNQSFTLRLLTISACIGFLLMFGTIVQAILNGDLSIEGPQLITMPWGIVSLVDIYLGLLLFSIWIIWREQSSISSVIWILLVLSLGNLLSCLYIMKAAFESKGSVERFWLGKNLEESHTDAQ